MAGIKITDLPAAPSAQLTDVFPVDQGATTYKESNSQLLTLFKANGEALTRTNDTNVTMTLGGAPTTALLNATSITLGWTAQLAVPRGGTGNSTFTAYSVICAGTTATGAFQNVVGVGNAGEQLTSNGAGLLPTWQPSSTVTPSALTKVDDTNVTLTLGGTPATALLEATSITVGWAGQLSLSRGGTNKNITPDNGALVYCDADSLELLAATATAGQIPRSGANAAPTWSTATYPAAAGTSGNVLTSDGTNWNSTAPANVSPLTTKGDLYTFTTVNARLPVGSTNGQVLQVASGAASGLAWSAATFPSTAINTARILRSDGTNWVETTSTFADTYAASGFLYANGANNIAGLATANNGLPVTGNTGIPVMLGGPGATGRVLTSNAAGAPSWSTSTFPSVGGAAGNILISDGTNYIASTSLWPNTVGTAGKILRSDGTTNAYTTATFPTTAGSSGNVLTSDGTNWSSSAPTGSGTVNSGTANQLAYYATTGTAVSGLTSANNGALVTSSGGVPSISTNLPAGMTIGGVAIGMITSWVAYTPTITGFGTPTNVAFFSRRVGDCLEIIGRFTAGTATGVKGTITMGYAGTSANVSSNATIVPTIRACGVTASSYSTASAPLTTLIDSNVNYLSMGVNTIGNASLTEMLGNALPNSTSYSMQASVPITTWP